MILLATFLMAMPSSGDDTSARAAQDFFDGRQVQQSLISKSSLAETQRCILVANDAVRAVADPTDENIVIYFSLLQSGAARNFPVWMLYKSDDNVKISLFDGIRQFKRARACFT